MENGLRRQIEQCGSIIKGAVPYMGYITTRTAQQNRYWGKQLIACWMLNHKENTHGPRMRTTH